VTGESLNPSVSIGNYIYRFFYANASESPENRPMNWFMIIDNRSLHILTSYNYF